MEVNLEVDFPSILKCFFYGSWPIVEFQVPMDLIKGGMQINLFCDGCINNFEDINHMLVS